MEGSYSPLHGFPDTIAVFPLAGALLLPAGKLPLNVFEPRYRALTEDSLGSGRMFGVIQPDPGKPDLPTGPALYRVGCLGRLSSFSETDDGRYLITLTGVIRFAVSEEVEGRRGYRRVKVDLSPYRADLEEDGSSPAGIDRAALLTALRAYFTRRGFEANWDAIDAMADDMLVVTLCMVCPFEPAAKQALLEAPTLADRAGTLLAILQIDAHGPTSDDDPPRRAS